MKSGGSTIRKATLRDCPRCFPLLNSLYHGDIGTGFRKALESYVVGDRSVVLLAQSQRKPVGILIGSFQNDIDWEGETARIDAIIVNEKHRRTGIGKKLAQRFLALAKKRRCKAVKSRVNIRNRTAQEFHESLGFGKADTYEYILEFHDKGPGPSPNQLS